MMNILVVSMNDQINFVESRQNKTYQRKYLPLPHSQPALLTGIGIIFADLAKQERDRQARVVAARDMWHLYLYEVL
jgi:hypothetical protein